MLKFVPGVSTSPHGFLRGELRRHVRTGLGRALRWRCAAYCLSQDRTGKKINGPGKIHGHHRRSCKITMTVIREKTVKIIDKHRLVQGQDLWSTSLESVTRINGPGEDHGHYITTQDGTTKHRLVHFGSRENEASKNEGYLRYQEKMQIPLMTVAVPATLLLGKILFPRRGRAGYVVAWNSFWIFKITYLEISYLEGSLFRNKLSWEQLI